MATEEKRINYWRMSREFFSGIRIAKPNAAHKALAELEKMGKLDFILTQNVDNLHQKAGNSPSRVVELHGTVFSVSCLSCGKKYAREEIERRIDQGVQVPACDELLRVFKAGHGFFRPVAAEGRGETAFDRPQIATSLWLSARRWWLFPRRNFPCTPFITEPDW